MYETSHSTPHDYYFLVTSIDSFISLIILNVFISCIFFQIVLLAQILMVIISSLLRQLSDDFVSLCIYDYYCLF